MSASERCYRKFKRRVDRLSFLIVATDYPSNDIRIERLFLRTEAARLVPGQLQLYDMIYECRFKRLLDQFRNEECG